VKDTPEISQSQRCPVVAIFFVLVGVFLLAWSDAIPREPATLGAALVFITLIIFLSILDRRHLRKTAATPPIVPLDLSDRRAQVGLLGLCIVVGTSLLNPSHEAVFVPTGSVPEELQGYQESNDQDAGAQSFVSAFEPREEVVNALPTTVDRNRTAVWGLQLLVAFLTAVAVAHWARHRTGVIRFACWFIFLHAILLSWVALNFKINGAETILGRFENANPRFYGPFRYNNFWVAWLVLSLGAGVTLFSNSVRKRSTPGIVLTLIGFLSLIPPLLTAQSRSAFVVVGLFIGLSLLRALFLLPILAKASRGKVLWVGFGATATAGLIAVVAVVSTWEKWATMENAEAQKIERMGDTIKQFAELREGKIPDLRPAMARDGIKAGLLKPVFGWGLGSFEYAHPLVAGPEFMDDENQQQTKFFGKMLRVKHIHNDWVQFWAETGTAGFTLLVITVWAFWSKHSRATRGTAMGGGLLTGCACVAIFALWDFPLNDFAVQCLFAVCFGLAIAARRPSRSLLKAEGEAENDRNPDQSEVRI
jgi:O-antigen ligase